MSNKVKYACLFSGIGAPLQGAYRVYGQKNIEHIFSCEIDKFARQSFQAIYNMDEAHFHQDIYELNGTQYQDKVDILVGGSPCQAFSLAGLRKGVSDKRGQLIYEYIRIVDEVKAPIIIYENVKGIMSIDGGRTIKDFVQALRDIGYYCHYEVINTKDYGVPQNRERLFLVGFLDHEHYHRFQFAPKIKLEKRLRDVLEYDVDEKFYLSDKFIQGMETHKERHKDRGNGFAFEPKSADEIESINCLSCGYGSRPTDTYINEGVIGTLDIKDNDQIKRVYDTDFISPTLQTMQGGNREPKIQVIGSTMGGNDMNSRIYGLDGLAPTLNAGNNGGGQSPVKHLTEDYRIRKLTPLECWRLQDFSDDSFYKAQNAGVSNSQLYKQAGNSMSVNVLEMILRQIEKTRFKNAGGLF